MARDHARLMTSIWADADFTALSSDAQRLYLLALSQSSLSYVGVVPFTVRRWSGLARNTTEKHVRRAVSELEATRYVLVDDDTEELLVRSFIRNDGLLASPNVCRAAVKAYRAVVSPRLRTAVLLEVHRLQEDQPDARGWDQLDPLLSEPFPEGFAEGFAEGFHRVAGKGSTTRATPLLSTAPTPPSVEPFTCQHGYSEPTLCALCRVASRRSS